LDVADITLAEIEADPYPVFERLRRKGPIGWIEPLQMWWVVGYDEVQAILANSAAFTTRFEASTIFDTFGEQMLTSEGVVQERYRAPFRGAFSPKAVRHAFEAAVGEIATTWSRTSQAQASKISGLSSPAGYRFWSC
jgi:cytochrome P450